MNYQESNQTVNQPETVASVTNDQATQVTAPATDTKPVDNTQDTTANTPVAPTVPETVKLELTAEEAEMIQELLNNFVYAYRSDREVDYKRELVTKDKVGKYPYVAEPPAQEIINPAYDWINKKWYSKSGSTSLPEIAQAVKTLQSDQQAGTTQNLALTKAVKELSEGQANQNKLLASMQQLMLALTGNKQATPAQPSTETTDTKQENGGN